MENDIILKAQKEVEAMINAGAPIVKLDIFDVFNQYVPSELMQNKIQFTLDLYFDLLNNLKEYSEDNQKLFLETLKESDIIDNQSIEKENSFLKALNEKFDKTFSVDLLLKLVYSNSPILKEEFIKIHDVMLLGTSSKNKLGLRDNDLKFVGAYQTNPQTKFHFENRAISYFPLRHTEIDAALDKLLENYNNGLKFNNKYSIVLIPMIYHGLIAALQLFKDGNTRYGRLFQSVLMHKYINQYFNLDLELPLVYASRQYAAYRDDYRKKVENIVLNNDVEAWEAWFDFNLKRIQDGIYYNINCLNYLKTNKK